MQINALRLFLIIVSIIGVILAILSKITILDFSVAFYAIVVIFVVVLIFAILIKNDDSVMVEEPAPAVIEPVSSSTWSVPRNLDEAYSVMRKQAEELDKVKEFYNEERQKANTIRSIAHDISVQKDHNELYKTVLELIRTELKCQSAFLMVINNGVLKLRYNDGVITDITLKVLETSGLLDPLVKKGQSVRLGAVDKDNIFDAMVGSHERIKNLLCVPMKTQSDPLPFALIGVANRLMEGDFASETEEFLNLIAIEVAISIKNIGYINELERNYEDTLLALAQALEGRDKYTHGHVDRVKEFSEKLAIEMGLPDNEIKKIRKAATLHDVGKISTPDNILHKQSRLTDEEWSEMRKHAEMSAKILEPIQSLPREVVSMVLYHHERWDGGGYPKGLKGTEIPLGAQIIAIADAFDAMTSDRPYRKGMTFRTALDLLKIESVGTQFSEKVANTFIKMMEKRVERMDRMDIKNGIVIDSQSKSKEPQTESKSQAPEAESKSQTQAESKPKVLQIELPVK